MTEHTPAPWAIDSIEKDSITAKGTMVAHAAARSNKAQEFANAAFIVKAVNSHDALVKALEFIRDGYANQDVNHGDYRVKVYQVALDALALVGGARQP